MNEFETDNPTTDQDRRAYAETRYPGDLAADLGVAGAGRGVWTPMRGLALAASVLLAASVGWWVVGVDRQAPLPPTAEHVAPVVPTPNVIPEAAPSTKRKIALGDAPTLRPPRLAEGLQLSKPPTRPKRISSGLTPRRFPGLGTKRFSRFSSPPQETSS